MVGVSAVTNRDSLDIWFTFDLRPSSTASPSMDHFVPETVDDDVEFDPPSTIESIDSALVELGHRVVRVGGASSLMALLVEGSAPLPDLVFNIAEGRAGRAREGQVPSILEVAHVPYVFSDPVTMAICHVKSLAKTLLRARGLGTPEWCIVVVPEDLPAAVDLLARSGRVIVKPEHEGNGKGIERDSVVSTRADLESRVAEGLVRYRQPMLVERFLPGREVTVGVIGTGSAASVLGLAEWPGAADPGAVFGWREKEGLGHDVPLTAASGELAVHAGRLALEAHRLTGCRDGSRVDLRCDADGGPQVLEVNPLPGLHPHHSFMAKIAQLHATSYTEMLGHIVNSARSRAEHSASPT
jgi:D-alanine-D-alanine ligase